MISNSVRFLHATSTSLTISYPSLSIPGTVTPSLLTMNASSDNTEMNHSPNNLSINRSLLFNTELQNLEPKINRSIMNIYRIEYYTTGFTSFLSRWQPVLGFGSLSCTAFDDLIGPEYIPPKLIEYGGEGGRQIVSNNNNHEPKENIYSMMDITRLPKQYQTISRHKMISTDQVLHNTFISQDNITLSLIFTITNLQPQYSYIFRIIPGILQVFNNDNNNDINNSHDYKITWYSPYPPSLPFTTLSSTEENNRLLSIEHKKQKLIISHDSYVQRSISNKQLVSPQQQYSSDINHGNYSDNTHRKTNMDTDTDTMIKSKPSSNSHSHSTTMDLDSTLGYIINLNEQ